MPQWEGDCEDEGEWEGGFLAGEPRGTAQAKTADLGHGEAGDRTGWGMGIFLLISGASVRCSSPQMV